jgi:hypothetical protein
MCSILETVCATAQYLLSVVIPIPDLVDELGNVAHATLTKHTRAMLLHRPRANSQLLSNILVAVSIDQEIAYLGLAAGEWGHVAICR